MATKKSLGGDSVVTGPLGPEAEIEERRRRKEEAVVVDGTESFPPPGMNLPDGGTVPLDEPVAPGTGENKK